LEPRLSIALSDERFLGLGRVERMGRGSVQGQQNRGTSEKKDQFQRSWARSNSASSNIRKRGLDRHTLEAWGGVQHAGQERKGEGIGGNT